MKNRIQQQLSFWLRLNLLLSILFIWNTYSHSASVNIDAPSAGSEIVIGASYSIQFTFSSPDSIYYATMSVRSATGASYIVSTTTVSSSTGIGIKYAIARWISSVSAGWIQLASNTDASVIDSVSPVYFVTATPTSTNTPASTNTPTSTYTPTYTSTLSPTQTPTPLPYQTNTPTNTLTYTPSNTATVTPTPTVTNTFTETPTFTNTPTSTNTPLYPAKEILGIGNRYILNGDFTVENGNVDGNLITINNTPFALNHIADVTTYSTITPAADNHLAYDGSYWIPATPIPAALTALSATDQGALMDKDFTVNGILIRTAQDTYGVTANNTSNWDNAYSERGSVIGGTNLDWDGSELDVETNLSNYVNDAGFLTSESQTLSDVLSNGNIADVSLDVRSGIDLRNWPIDNDILLNQSNNIISDDFLILYSNNDNAEDGNSYFRIEDTNKLLFAGGYYSVNQWVTNATRYSTGDTGGYLWSLNYPFVKSFGMSLTMDDTESALFSVGNGANGTIEADKADFDVLNVTSAATISQATFTDTLWSSSEIQAASLYVNTGISLTSNNAAERAIQGINRLTGYNDGSFIGFGSIQNYGTGMYITNNQTGGSGNIVFRSEHWTDANPYISIGDVVHTGGTTGYGYITVVNPGLGVKYIHFEGSP